MTEKKQQAIITYIKNSRQQKIKEYRHQQEPRFIRWAKRKFKASEAEAKAAYDKAFEIFCRKIKAGEFRSLTANPETFLFGIGKHCMMKIKYPPKRKKEKPKLIITETLADSANPVDEKIEEDHKKILLQHLLQKLTPHCASLIRAKKIERKSIAQIQKEKKYRNANTTKVAISKCYTCLKKIAKQSKKKG